MDKARVAGNLAAGYHEVYWKLAVLAVVCGGAAGLLRAPKRASN